MSKNYDMIRITPAVLAEMLDGLVFPYVKQNGDVEYIVEGFRDEVCTDVLEKACDQLNEYFNSLDEDTMELG